MHPTLPDHPTKEARARSSLLNWLRQWNLPLLAVAYVAAYLLIDTFVDTVVRHYVFSVVLVVSSLYFSWYLGGRETMLYVTFFNIFFAFIFSRLLHLSGGGLFAGNLFLGRSFLALYVVSVLFMIVMLKTKSPADLDREKREQRIREERDRRRQLELMVATQKLTGDMVRQANRVKDELLLLNGAWKSQIHSIINDLPKVKERELYDQIVAPFQESIINHLRELETRLSFSPQALSLDELHDFLARKLAHDRIAAEGRVRLDLVDHGWAGDTALVHLDTQKTWEILLNLIRNGQSAIELRQIEMLRSGSPDRAGFKPRILVSFERDGDTALLKVADNGGGAEQEVLDRLFHQAVPSKKRHGKSFGQGTMFVKFFGHCMGIDIKARNTGLDWDKGLEVALAIPLNRQPLPDEHKEPSHG